MPTFTIGELLTFALVLAAAAAPAIAWLRLDAPELPATDAVILGTLAGVALYIAALSYVDVRHGAVAIGVTIVWLAAAAFLWTRGARWRAPQPAPDDRPYARRLVVLLAIQYALLLLPSLDNPLPLGNDAVYHVAISDKLARTGEIPGDFLPYDPVAPTYTLGSHLAVTFASLRTGVPVHRLYQFALPLFVVIVTGLLFHLGRLAFGARAGFWGAFVFAFLANWGSLDLLRWGSLPNAAGMAFFVAAARLVLAPAGRWPWLLPALFVGAMAATHHLSALIFGLVSAAIAVVHARRHGWRAPAVTRLAVAWAGGLVLVAPSVWSLAAEVVRSVSSSEQAALDSGVPYLNVVEPLIPIWEVPENLGILLFALGAMGLWTIVRGRHKTPLVRALLAWTATIAFAFAMLDWPVRWLVDAVWGQDLAILTPSRFLTDLSYPLCLFAGVALVRLWQRSRGLAWLTVAAAPCYALWMLLPLATEQIPRSDLQGLLWFSRSSPENSLLLQAPVWTTYVSGREGDWMVLREERLSEYTDRKRKLADQGTGAIETWMKTHNRPVYLWETRDLQAGNLEKVWQGDGSFIYRFVARERQ